MGWNSRVAGCVFLLVVGSGLTGCEIFYPALGTYGCGLTLSCHQSRRSNQRPFETSKLLGQNESLRQSRVLAAVEGDGVSKYFGDTDKWYILTANGGNAQAAENRDKLEQRMASERIEAINNWAVQWKPENARRHLSLDREV
jgi:hypothetical protein